MRPAFPTTSQSSSVKRRSFLMALREYLSSLKQRLNTHVSNSLDIGWTIEATPKWHTLSPIVERLEDRVLLATNIGVVRPDLAHSNDLLSFYLDTQPLTGTRDDNSEIQFHFGLSSSSPGSSGANDLAIVGDWGNLGFDQGGVARNNVAAGAKQFFLDTNRDTNAEYAFRFGLPGDGVVSGNFDGLYGDDVGVTRNNNGFKHWYLALASSDSTESFPRNDTTVGVSRNFVFGLDSDFARAGDFNGDGIDDAVVIRNVSGNLTWYVSHGPFPNDGSTLPVHQTIQYGINGYIPVVGDWDNDGDDNMGVIVNNNGAAEWYMDTNGAGPYEIFLSYGTFSDQIVVGQWADRVWDGGAGSSDFNNAVNWSSNTLPSVNSSALIDVPGSTQFLYAGAPGANIGSLHSNEFTYVSANWLILNEASYMRNVGVIGGQLTPRKTLTIANLGVDSGIVNTDQLGGNIVVQTLYDLRGGTISLPLGGSQTANISIGTVTFSGANTYTGGTSIAAGGTLALGNSAAIPSGSNTTLGGVLDLNGYSPTVGTLNGNGSVVLDGGTFTTNSAGNSSFSGTFSGSGTVVKNGSGTLTLSSPSTNVGATHVLGGVLEITTANVLSNDSDVNLSPGTTLRLNGLAERVGAIGGSGTIDLGTNNPSLKTNANLSSSFFGSIIGSGNLVKDGTATLELYGASTFTGALSVQGGTLRLQNSNLLADNLPITVTTGGVFDLNGKNETVGEVTGSSSVLLGSGTLTTVVTNNSILATTISGTGGVTKSGTGTLTIDSNKLIPVRQTSPRALL